MLKGGGSCILTRKIETLTHSRIWVSPNSIPSTKLRRNVSISFSSAQKRPDLAVSVSTTTTANNGVCKTGSGLGSLADRLRLGSLAEDGFSYKESFIVRCYEVGINKTATVETIANLLQEVGSNHALSLGFSTDGFGTTPAMRKLHLIWVTARMHIEIYRYPTWSDVVEIETWYQADGNIRARRDLILKDYANGEVIGRSTSTWVMMNMDTRKLARVTPQVAKEHLIHCPQEPRLLFPEKENNKSLRKIPKLGDSSEYSKLGLVPRRADLAMNRHVNNVTYISWVLESMPQEIIDTHELGSITLDYRRECQQDDVIDSLTSPELIPKLKPVDGAPTIERTKDDSLEFVHLLRLSADGSEINRARTEWRLKPQR